MKIKSREAGNGNGPFSEIFGGHRYKFSIPMNERETHLGRYANIQKMLLGT